MGWRDTIQKESAPVKSWRDTIQKEELPPSQLESLGRGAAQVATLGFEDELAGVGGALGSRIGAMGVDKIESTHPGVQAQIEALTPEEKSFNTLRQEATGEERALNKSAKEANPWTYGAGELLGGIANPISSAAKGLKGSAALGAVYGLGGSESDLTKGDVLGAAKDVAIGAAGGSAGYGLGKAIPKAIGGVKYLGKKALTTLGPSEEAITARLAGRAQPGAKSYPELAEKMGESLEDLDNQISSLSKEAAGTLSDEKNIPSQYLQSQLDDAIKNQGPLVGPSDKQVNAAYKALKEDIAQYGDTVSQKDIKGIIQKLDDNINWKDQTRKELNSALKGIRFGFDESLKFQNPQYKAAMQPVSDRMKVMDKIDRLFSFDNEPGLGLRPTDTTATKIKTSLHDNKAVTEGVLNKLKEFTGKDYSELAKDYQLSQQFQKTGAQGSRRTVAGKAIGTAIGGLGGLVLGGPMGAGVGASAGHAAGAVTGAAMDTYGGQVAGKIIDSYVKAGNSQVFGKFAPVLQAASKRGPQALSVTSSMLASDPEFSKMLRTLIP